VSQTVAHASVTPDGPLSVLSQVEVNRLCTTRSGEMHRLFRRCALAVLSSGNYVDDEREILKRFADFEIHLEQEDRGIRLHVHNAPATAFVDGVMIRGIQQQLFAVLRDIVFVHQARETQAFADENSTQGITDLVFHILRNADLFRSGPQRGVTVCWGGHAINRVEYEYTKEVGYQLGLRGLDVCTGCGPGAMKGPMKGATIGHAKQRMAPGRYIGISEPGIIAAESPNPIVNELVVTPDMEKRLEAFVRLGHGIVVFPGGVGTAEEVLYLLGVLSHPDNHELPFPLILTGPADSRAYWQLLHEFIEAALGPEFTTRYRIIIGDAPAVAAAMRQGIDAVLNFRDLQDDAPYFNWSLRVDLPFQSRFVATHAHMAELNLDPGRPGHELACDLRRAFSGIVSGNVKEEGMRRVERYGPFELSGDRAILSHLDRLLTAFVKENRMKLDGRSYRPCYRLVA